MIQRPILFQGAMVRALLAGSKTQTRRVVKFKGADLDTFINRVSNKVVCCPYGQPGHQLWVRETFCPIYPQDPSYNGGAPIEYDYAATYTHGDRLGDSLGIKKVWKPSIHMPRTASRITLEITGVRIERLWTISEEDSIAEGLEAIDRDKGYWRDYEAGYAKAFFKRSAWASYRTLWISINGIESWDANPLVWVVEFKRVDGGAL